MCYVLGVLTSSYLDLPEETFERVAPTPVRAPKLLLWNARLAEELQGPLAELGGRPEAAAGALAGNELLPGSEPIALAYAGHQFGHFVPQLGDGRAHLLGEVADRAGRRRDIQLKGSGRTRFSRGGDGRCAVGPAVRELIMSEALFALGVPTTRSLAVVVTGEPVYREQVLPGAVLTRVAASHLRVGTFEYFAARGKRDTLRALCDYTVARHYPDLAGEGEGPGPLALLDRVIERQIELVVGWMRIGFIHGVMNTDNTALSGETIDYGPCAMMSVYHPRTVFSSIDQLGRYAFGNQPAIVQWNLARLAECLLPLIDDEPKRAIERAAPLIEGFPERFEHAFLKMMAGKLGLATVEEGDKQLVSDLLETLAAHQLDYTVTFTRLADALESETTRTELRGQLGAWLDRWHEKILAQDPATEPTTLMRRHNPVVIPRNHHVESVLAQVAEGSDPTPAERLLEVLRSPYEALPETAHYQDPPADGDATYRTFCGT